MLRLYIFCCSLLNQYCVIFACFNRENVKNNTERYCMLSTNTVIALCVADRQMSWNLEREPGKTAYISKSIFRAGNCMFKVKHKNTRARGGICSKLTIRIPERRQMASFWCLHCQLWIYFTSCSSASIVNFKQVNAGWVISFFNHKFLLISPWVKDNSERQF